MKCEKCNNEAVFHMQSNINGEKSEAHLCSDCANKEGYGRMMQSPVLTGFFPGPFGGLMGGFLRSSFGSFDALANSFFGQGLPSAPVASPEAGIEARPVANEKDRCADIPEHAGEELRAKRELCALKHRLQEAIKAEEFEQAAMLRDQIRALEK